MNIIVQFIIIFFCLSCSISSTPDYALSGKSLTKNKIKIIGFSGISQSIRSSNFLPDGVSEAVITFYDIKTGDVAKVLSLKKGIYEDVGLLADGSYRLVAEFLDGRTLPPPPHQLKVVDGKFDPVHLVSKKVEHNAFYYKWESDSEGYETEYSLNDDVIRKIEFLEDEVVNHNNSAARILEEDYNIILSNERDPWNYALASRLLREIASLPHVKLEKPTKFVLEAGETHVPISIDWKKNRTTVVLNFKIFSESSKKLIKLDGKRGHFFSIDLFKALVTFFTQEGENRNAVNKILQEKFAVTTEIRDFLSLTGEHSDNFQDFHSEELLHIIHAFAEMPQGYHKIPGLRYLVRRRNGHPHPIYPFAAAVAWPKGADTESYIEFMDTAFISGSRDSVHRLILHEKSHFLWSNIFSQKLKDEWIKLGKWFLNEEASSGWSTQDNLHFVSPYAHDVNPNEDMAESLSHYILNPEKLLSLAPEKFKFIENNIMKGKQYISQIRDDLTFEVFNLFPDYDFPGKIRQVEVEAKGNPEEDKKVSIVIELTNKDGIQDGAKMAYTRVYSPQDTFKDVYLYPVAGNAHKLKGIFTVPKKSKRGYWKVENIHITDQAGNERYEGVVDFGFKLYINNGEEDVVPPRYVNKSMNIQVVEGVHSEKQIFDFDITWKVDEAQEMMLHQPVYARLVSLDHSERHRIEGYGKFDKTTRIAQVNLTLTEYHPPGRYGVVFIGMQDKALNWGRQYFSDDPKHEVITWAKINPKNSDYKNPVLDEDSITVEANPLNVDSPDGSTIVHIDFYAKDDKSGIGPITYRLKDPLGRVHFNYFTHGNTYTLFFSGGKVKEYRHYRIETLLPKGSPPGIWGVMEIVLTDKSGNSSTYNFVKTMHFELEE